MSLKLNSSGGGSVTLSEPVTASNRNVNIPDFDGTAVLAASSGTSGQVLTSNGASSLPSWQTISTSPTTAQVLGATAGAAAGDVGSYAYCMRSTINTSIVAGTTYAGSGLVFAGAETFGSGTSSPNSGSEGASALSGTWRAMGTHTVSVTNAYSKTMFVRIS